MSNMSYCRFENTSKDLQDCLDNWNKPTSDSEEKHKLKIYELAKDIVEKVDSESINEFGDTDEEDLGENS